MKVSRSEKLEFMYHISELLEHDQVEQMKYYIQHGTTDTYTHCLAVAYFSYVLALRLPMHFDFRSVIRGAMLHDFYLYDWHVPDPSHRLHGFHHPRFALENARRYFQLNPVEEDIIDTHMWPLTLRKLPAFRESLLVCMVDKICSMGETFYLPVLPRDYLRLHHMMMNKKPIY